MAQQQILFRKYSVTDGLCSNTVWSISQDEKGYMWFGTKNGLNRFDGYEFKAYRFNKNDTNAIRNNFIHTICKYDEKNYWIGTEGGVYNLDLETERFSPIPIATGNLIYDILRDSRGMMWIATRGHGVYSYNPIDKKTVHFTPSRGNSNTVSLNQVRNLEEDSRGRIWMGTFGEGIDVFDPSTMKFSHFKAGARGSNANKVLTLYCDLEGNMWAGGLGGLQVYSKNTDELKTYTKDGAGSINDNIVRAIYQPSPDKLYVGTEKGFNILNLEKQTFTAHTNKVNDPHSISDNAVYSIYPDREGGIWVGTFFGGLNYFPENGSAFELYYATGESNALSGNAVSSFIEDKPGFFWIGTENAGRNYFDSHTKNIQALSLVWFSTTTFLPQYSFAVKRRSPKYMDWHIQWRLEYL